MRPISFVSLVILLVGVTFTAAFAHHDPGSITSGEAIKWQGAISKVSWDGAHVMYRIDVADADGSIHSWQVLGGSPQRLAKRGIKSRMLNKGDRIVVAGYLDRSIQRISPVYIAPLDNNTGPLEDPIPAKLFVGYFSSDEQFVEPALSTPR